MEDRNVDGGLLRSLLACAALFCLASCGSGDGTGAKAPGSEDLEAALETARLMRKIGLTEAAVSECEFVVRNAGPAHEEAVARAMLLAGDSALDAKNLGKALTRYRETASRFPAHAPEAFRKIARAHVSRGHWAEALEVLQGIDREGLSPEEARPIEDLEKKIAPVTRLTAGVGWNFKEGEGPDKAGVEAMRRWIVEDPFRFGVEGADQRLGRLHIRFQKSMGCLAHPLPWAGDRAFRLRLRLRVDGVDPAEHEIMGLIRLAYLPGAIQKGDADREQDELAIVLRSVSEFQGETTTRNLQFRRVKSSPSGADHHEQLIYSYFDFTQGDWYELVLEYLPGLATFRYQVIKPRVRVEDEILKDRLITGIRPFGKGPFGLVFGGVKGGGTGHPLEVSVDRILFETEPGVPMTSPEVNRILERPRLRANALSFSGKAGAAVKVWRDVLEKSNQKGMLLFSVLKGLRRMGRLEEADEVEDRIVESLASLRPVEMDHFQLLSLFDADATRLWERIQKKRGR